MGISLDPPGLPASVAPLAQRTNLAINGAARDNLVGWSATWNGATGQQTRVQDSAGFYGQLMTFWTNASSASFGGAKYGSSTLNSIAIPSSLIGQNIASSVCITSSRRQRMRIEAQYYDSSNAKIGASQYGASVVVLPGRLAKLTHTGVVPSGAIRMSLDATIITSAGDGVTWQTGDTLLASQLIVEAGVSTGPFFSGDDPGCAWVGSAGASASTCTTLAPRSADFPRVPTVSGVPLVTRADLDSFASYGLVYKAAWRASVSYGAGDLIYTSGAWWVCTTQHIASTTFGADRDTKWLRVSHGPALSARTPSRGASDLSAARWAQINQPRMSLPPAVSWLASGFDLTTILGSGYVEHPYSESGLLVRRIGMLTGTLSVASTTVETNVINGSGLRTPFELETVVNSTDGKLVVTHVPQAQTAYPSGTAYNPGIFITVDGQPVSRSMIRDSTVSNTLRAISITGLPTGRPVLVRIMLQGIDWRSIAVSSGTTLTAPASTRKKGVILGDSWTAGGSNTTPHPTYPLSYAPILARLLDIDAAYAGQGSTGYTVTPGAPQQPFGHSDRLMPIYSYAPDYLIVVGSINDDSSAGSSSSTVQSAAAALYSAVATNLPACKIIVVGPQSTGFDITTGRRNNATGVAAAAAAASNVLGQVAVSPALDGWTSGQGKVGSPDGVGTADTYMHSDGLHPTIFGAAYFARRIHEAVVEIGLTAGLVGYDGFAL